MVEAPKVHTNVDFARPSTPALPDMDSFATKITLPTPLPEVPKDQERTKNSGGGTQCVIA